MASKCVYVPNAYNMCNIYSQVHNLQPRAPTEPDLLNLYKRGQRDIPPRPHPTTGDLAIS